MTAADHHRIGASHAAPHSTLVITGVELIEERTARSSTTPGLSGDPSTHGELA